MEGKVWNRPKEAERAVMLEIVCPLSWTARGPEENIPMNASCPLLLTGRHVPQEGREMAWKGRSGTGPRRQREL